MAEPDLPLPPSAPEAPPPVLTPRDDIAAFRVDDPRVDDADGLPPADPATLAANGKKNRKERPPKSPLRSTVEWIAVIAGALVIALVVRTFLVQMFYIPSESMENTLVEGDRLLVNKLSYKLHEVHRGDIVVFERPPESASSALIRDLVKRVVALEGETIEVQDGRVFINGRELTEPYLAQQGVTRPLSRKVVPKDHVFVMGDNRASTVVLDPIHEDLIVGRAFIRVWPLSELRLL